MQWRHRSVRIALRDINKKDVEIGERQNRCHDDKLFLLVIQLPFNVCTIYFIHIQKDKIFK